MVVMTTEGTDGANPLVHWGTSGAFVVGHFLVSQVWVFFTYSGRTIGTMEQKNNFLLELRNITV